MFTERIPFYQVIEKERNSQHINQPPPLPQLTRTVIEDQRKFEGWRTEKRKNL